MLAKQKKDDALEITNLSNGLVKMESKVLICHDCSKTQLLFRDSHTGMWELVIGYGSISNSSWEYLEKTWLEIHHTDCLSKLPAH